MASLILLMRLCRETFAPSEPAVYWIDDIVSYFRERSTCRGFLAPCSYRRSGGWLLLHHSTFLSAASIVISTTSQMIDPTIPEIFVDCGGELLVRRSILQ